MRKVLEAGVGVAVMEGVVGKVTRKKKGVTQEANGAVKKEVMGWRRGKK
jgi:hypothetical protein